LDVRFDMRGPMDSFSAVAPHLAAQSDKKIA